MYPYQKNSKILLRMSVWSENVYVPFFRRVYAVVAQLSQLWLNLKSQADQSTYLTYTKYQIVAGVVLIDCERK